ncbi:hypothetical protein ANO14919_032950 [Xylariales sp. No.14919]|nr:hypothetical protein ANO14919_032950 [Xylariales sp. No.14919]
MRPRSVPGNRITYFQNGIDVQPAWPGLRQLSSQPPRQSPSPVAIASRGRGLSLHGHQRPRPFFSQGPAASPYFSPQVTGYYRRPGLQPITPLREEFSAMNSVHGNDRSMALQELEQSRPHSVPSHYLQTSQPNVEHSAREIPRPASAAYMSVQRPVSSNDHSLNPLSEGAAEKRRPLPSKRGASDDPDDLDDFMPPKRKLPFPPSERAKAQTMNSEAQLGAVIDPSLSSHHYQSSQPESSGQPFLKTDSILDEPLCARPDVPKKVTARRRASQATTVSATSTTPSCPAGNEHTRTAKVPSHWTLEVDEDMILQLDIGEIVDARLQQGDAKLLDTLNGELLIKMAVMNEKLFEEVRRILES